MDWRSAAKVGVLAFFCNLEHLFVYGRYADKSRNAYGIQLGRCAHDAIAADCLVDNGGLAMFTQHRPKNLVGVFSTADVECLF